MMTFSKSQWKSITYLILLIHDDVFEEPVEGRLDVGLFVLLFAHGQNSGVVEKQFAPFAGESLAPRIGSRKVVARRTAD